jgi:uncharacterized membrane protein (UPF0127 family)
MRTFKYNKKRINVIECKTFFSKFRGLMFRKKSLPLLFVFKNPTREGIHSFFCKPFLAVWFLKGKVVEKRVVLPFTIYTRPEKPYTELLEIILE